MMVRMKEGGRLQEAFLAEARKGVTSARAGACLAAFKAVHLSGAAFPASLSHSVSTLSVTVRA